MVKTTMNSSEFCKKAKEIADNYNTVYMWGTFGHRVTDYLITSKANQYKKWYTPARIKLFHSMKGFWAFDCVGLIKAILWGWCGDTAKNRGGVVYPTDSQITAGAVPDTSADGMIQKCHGVSGDFSTIQAGEVVWQSGHIGIYIGDGLVVEATPKWKNCVQISALSNLGRKAGYNHRKWTKHGKLPWVDYKEEMEVDSMTYYETINDVPAGEFRNTVQKLIDRGTIKGNGKNLHLSEDNVRLLVYLNREKLFDD